MPTNPVTHEEFTKQRRHDMRLMKIAYLILALGVSLSLYFQWQGIKLNNTTRTSVCQFKADLRVRINESVQLLGTSDGKTVTINGLTIPKAIILTNIANQRRTVKSFDDLDCKGEQPEVTSTQ